MALAVSVKEVRDITVLELSGKLIFEESTGLHQKVKELIASDKRKIVINLEDVTFCGSAGIAALAGVYVSVQNCGGGVAIRQSEQADTGSTGCYTDEHAV